MPYALFVDVTPVSGSPLGEKPAGTTPALRTVWIGA
jgi:hypothetical protein